MGIEDVAKFAKFGRGAGDVGTAFMKSQKGLAMVDAAVTAGKVGGDAASMAKYASEQAAIINKGVLERMGRFTKQLDKASSNKLMGMGKTLSEQVGTYSAQLAKKLGDPSAAGELSKLINPKVTSIYKKSMKMSKKNLIGKTDEGAALTGRAADDVAEANATFGSRILNGIWPPGRGSVILAGMGILIWAGPLDALAGLTTTLERFNFLPEGTTNGLIAFWGKLRGFITAVLWAAILLGTFWVMNMVFGAAKTAKGVVDAVTDNIVPDAEPSGA